MRRILTNYFACFLFFLISGSYALLTAQDISISPQPIYFGQTAVDRDATREIVIRNVGSETLNITQISIVGTNAAEFSIVDPPGVLNLSPFSGRHEFILKFHPQSVGVKVAQIVFESNASSSPDNVDLLAGASPTNTFEKILGTLESDGARDVRPTADGGFIIAGNTLNEDEEKNDGYLIKTNAYGEIVWTEVYDGDDNDDNNDIFSSVIPVSDGYLAVGNSDINDNRRNDIWVVKTNLSGDFQWEKFFGRSDDNGASVIEATNDGHFIIAGFTRDPNGVTGNDGFLLKINNVGTELWSQVIGNTRGEKFSSVKQTADNGYIICGSISTGSSFGTDMLLVKTNAAGVVSWDEQYGDSDDLSVDQASSVTIAADGGYVLVGSTSDPSISAGAKDVYIVKTNSSGVKDATWGDKTFGENHQDGASEIISTSDGGYLIVGSIENWYEEFQDEWYSDVYIIKLDGDGNFEWDKVYGGNRGEGASTVRQLIDGSFVICGGTSSWSSTSDIYFLRIGSDGNITAIENNSIIIPNETQLIQNYPNPFNGTTIISYNLTKNSKVKLKIFDISGRLVSIIVDNFQHPGFYTIPFDAKTLASGIYMYQLSTENFSQTKRLLLLK